MASPARKLTMHQQAVLIQVLLAFPEQRVAVRYDPSVGDASSYAEDFLTIFQAIGWSVDAAAPVGRSSGQVAGLALVVEQRHGLPAGAEAFRDALRIYGIEVETVGDSSGCVAAGEFVLSVGADG
jgi:hypothetical protein